MMSIQQHGVAQNFSTTGDPGGADTPDLETIYSRFRKWASTQQEFHQLCVAFSNDREAVVKKYKEIHKKLYWDFFKATRRIDDLEIVSELAWSCRYLLENCLARLVELERKGVALEFAEQQIIEKVINEGLETEWSDPEFYQSILRVQTSITCYGGSLNTIEVLSNLPAPNDNGSIPAAINIGPPAMINFAHTRQAFFCKFLEGGAYVSGYLPEPLVYKMDSQLLWYHFEPLGPTPSVFKPSLFSIERYQPVAISRYYRSAATISNC